MHLAKPELHVMFHRVHQRLGDDRGFSLIEILVVVMIIGILAAIAIPAFIEQKGKASDASAKTQARTLQTAAETSANDRSGSYEGATLPELENIEATLKDHSVNLPSVPKATASEYEVQSESIATKEKYKVFRNKEGIVTRTCEPANKSGCGAGGSW
jgi:type IV pilus assembly protein PilA